MFNMPYINFRFSGNFTVDKIHVPEGGNAPTLPRKEAEDPLEGVAGTRERNSYSCKVCIVLQ